MSHDLKDIAEITQKKKSLNGRENPQILSRNLVLRFIAGIALAIKHIHQYSGS